MKFKQAHKAGGVVVELGPKETTLPLLTPEPGSAAAAVFRLKQILVPLDFSECSRKALVYATAFARQFEAEIALLYVVAPYPPVPQMDLVDLESIEDAETRLECERAKVEGVVTRSFVRTGEPHLEIVRAAAELNTDLIILATHGRTGLAHVVLGSTAEKVARHARCPILIVKEHEHEFLASAAAGRAESTNLTSA